MLHIYPTKAEVLGAAADYFITIAKLAISEKGRFTVALSGGSSPKGLFELLSSQYPSAIEWNKAFFFFGDERYVPSDDPDSNALMAKKALFEPLNIAANQIFTVDTSLAPDIAAATYQEAIQNHFATGSLTFDLILLGLGDDAHTASLFPNTDVVKATEIGVKDVYIEDKKTYRITFTAPLINKAKHVAFLVFGLGKADAVRQVLEGEHNYRQYPAQIIHPEEGELAWFMDDAAAAKLKK